jgi:hypothetical protein
MRITRGNVEELQGYLENLIDGCGQAFRDNAETWLEEEGDADERRDARAEMETALDDLSGVVADIAGMLR